MAIAFIACSFSLMSDPFGSVSDVGFWTEGGPGGHDGMLAAAVHIEHFFQKIIHFLGPFR